MKQQILSPGFVVFLLVLFAAYLPTVAQTTSIPDTQFEQILINEGIDTDGTINGQVLTSDIVGVLNLNLQFVNDLTGLQDFAALETLKLDEGGGFLYDDITVDLTANTNLKKVEIYSFGGLSKLDLTGLTSLEELRVRELVGDVITMEMDSLDLSTNTNINYINLGIMEFMHYINLQNGNNANMLNFGLSLSQDGQGLPMPDRPMCIKVDDASAAITNTSPYDSWIIYEIAPTFYDSGQCVLSVNDVETVDVTLYPNPVQNEFYLKSSVAIKGIGVFSLQGKRVAGFSFQQSYDISSLQTGIYFLKISTQTGVIEVQKIVKE